MENNVAEIEVNNKKRRRRKLHEITAENDIKFRGPLSYRHLRIVAWICFAMAQAGIVLSVAAKADPVWGAEIAWIINLLQLFGNLTIPLFLLASFAVILNAKDGYKNIIVFYAVCCVGFIIAFVVVYNHYLVGLVKAYSQDKESAAATTESIIQFITVMSGTGFFSMNVFLDLLLCTLFTYFINYHPVKRFQGKKLKWFRLFALIPVMYELASITLKIMAGLGEILLPVWVYPFLTSKPPAMFFMFILLAFFIKIRERIYRKRGKTLKDYKSFLKTNANSLHFSVYTTIIIIISIILDIIMLLVMTVILTLASGDVSEMSVISAFMLTLKLGFGGSIIMILAIPFVMLFSYTKTYKDGLIDKAIPVGGVALTVFVYFEGIFQLLCLFPDLLKNLFGG